MLPVGGDHHCGRQPDLKNEAKQVRGMLKIDPLAKTDCSKEKTDSEHCGKPGETQPKIVAPHGREKTTQRGILHVEMQHQRRNEPKAKTNKRPGKTQKPRRRASIKQLSI